MAEQLDLIPAPRSKTKEEWLEEAREVAKTVIMIQGKVSADDIWERMPRPPGDPRIMGSVFNGLKCVGYRKSRRSEFHFRPIGLWE